MSSNMNDLLTALSTEYPSPRKDISLDGTGYYLVTALVNPNYGNRHLRITYRLAGEIPVGYERDHFRSFYSTCESRWHKMFSRVAAPEDPEDAKVWAFTEFPGYEDWMAKKHGDQNFGRVLAQAIKAGVDLSGDENLHHFWVSTEAELVRLVRCIYPDAPSKSTLIRYGETDVDAKRHAMASIGRLASSFDAEKRDVRTAIMRHFAQWDDSTGRAVPWAEIRQAGHRIPFAYNDSGEIVSWDPSNNSTMLLLGAAGTGKTGAADAILSSAALLGYEMHVIDVANGGVEFRWLEPFTKQVASQLASAQIAANNLLQEFRSRLELLRQHGADQLSGIPADVRPAAAIIHVVHMPSLHQVSPSPDSSEAQRALIMSANQMRRDITHALNVIVKQGRAAGMLLLLESQMLTSRDREMLPSLSEADAVLVLGRTSIQMKVDAFGTADVPEMTSEEPRGRGVFRGEGSAPVAVQCWWAGDSSCLTRTSTHEAEMVEAISAHRSHRPTE